MRRESFLLTRKGSATVLLISFLLTGCESASCWNEIKGRFTDCQQMRSDEVDKKLNERLHGRSSND